MLKKIQNSILFKPTAIVLAFSLFCLSFVAPAGKVTLRAGTPIMVQLSQEISSKDVSAGQSISARVMTDVKVDGKIVITAGSPARGQVVSVTKPKGVGRPGSIGIMINSVQAIDGTQVQLSSINLSREGDDKKGLAWGLGIGLCLLTGIGFIVMFFIKGDDGKIAAGSTFDANVATNVDIQVE